MAKKTRSAKGGPSPIKALAKKAGAGKKTAKSAAKASGNRNAGKKAAKKKVVGKPKKAAVKAVRKPTPVAKKAAAKKQSKAKKPARKAVPAKKVSVKPAKKVGAKKAPVKKTAVKKAVKKVAKPVPAKINKVAKGKVASPKPVAASRSKPASKKVPAPPAAPVKKAAPTKILASPKAQEPATPKSTSSVKPNSPPKRIGKMVRVDMEFYMHSSPTALYELISTPSGFAEWYCQDVDVNNDLYTFIWDGEREETMVIGRKAGEVIRFHRMDDEESDTFFEFRVRVDAMTNEVALEVVDYVLPEEVEETRNLWSSQIHDLMRVLGA